MPASVTVEGGDLDRIWIASRTPLWNHLLSRSTILMFWESTLCLLYPILWPTGDEFFMFFESLFEGSFRSVPNVLVCQFIFML